MLQGRALHTEEDPVTLLISDAKSGLAGTDLYDTAMQRS